VLSLVLGLGISGAAHGQAAADVALARDLFREGVDLAQAGRWDEARERYRRSLALKRAPLTLYSLGVAQQQTGRLVDAIESFRAFLAEREAENPVTMPYEQPARDAIAALEKRVARLDIEILPAATKGVRLEVDGTVVPEAALGLPRPVDPGEHVVVVTAEGHRAARTTAKLGEGERAKVTLRLEPAPGPRPLSGPPVSSDGPSRALPVALLASGGTLFAAGLGVGLAGVGAAASAPTRDGPQATSARTLSLAGDIAGGVGLAVLGVGTVLMILTPANPPPSGPQAQKGAWVRPVVTVEGVGVRF
jgi:PEGA domain